MTEKGVVGLFTRPSMLLCSKKNLGEQGFWDRLFLFVPLLSGTNRK
jgi:hypothetical protein